MMTPVNPGGLIVDMLRSCYETKMRFPGADPELVKVRYFFVDNEVESVPSTVYNSLNWEPPIRGVGEVPGEKRKWVNGSAPEFTPGTFFGTEEAWLGNTDAESPQVESNTWDCTGPPPPPPPPLLTRPFVTERPDYIGSAWPNKLRYDGWINTFDTPRLVFYALAFTGSADADASELAVTFGPAFSPGYVPLFDLITGGVRLMIFQKVKDAFNLPESAGLHFYIPGDDNESHIAADWVAVKHFEVGNLGDFITSATSSGGDPTDEPSSGPLDTLLNGRGFFAFCAGETSESGPGTWQGGFTRIGEPVTIGGVTLDVAKRLEFGIPADGVTASRTDAESAGSSMLLLAYE